MQLETAVAEGDVKHRESPANHVRSDTNDAETRESLACCVRSDTAVADDDAETRESLATCARTDTDDDDAETREWLAYRVRYWRGFWYRSTLRWRRSKKRLWCCRMGNNSGEKREKNQMT